MLKDFGENLLIALESKYIPYHADLRIGRGKTLVLAPHPDDEVLGCAGAIMRHVADGDPVGVVILTDGAFGAGDRWEAVTTTREDESRRAATVMGYGMPEFWRLPDRGLDRHVSLVEDLSRLIARLAPDWVYAPSWWEIHPDHVALSRAITAVFRQESLAASLVLYEVGVPLHANRLLDITDLLERKRSALACFESQLAQQRYDSHILALNRFRTYTLPPTVEVAEAYRVIGPSKPPRELALPLLSENDRA